MPKLPYLPLLCASLTLGGCNDRTSSNEKRTDGDSDVAHVDADAGDTTDATNTADASDADASPDPGHAQDLPNALGAGGHPLWPWPSDQYVEENDKGLDVAPPRFAAAARLHLGWSWCKALMIGHISWGRGQQFSSPQRRLPWGPGGASLPASDRAA